MLRAAILLALCCSTAVANPCGPPPPPPWGISGPCARVPPTCVCEQPMNGQPVCHYIWQCD